MTTGTSNERRFQTSKGDIRLQQQGDRLRVQMPQGGDPTEVTRDQARQIGQAFLDHAEGRSEGDR